MLNDQLIDITAAIVCLAALLFGYLNTRKNGDSFVAAVSFIVAFVVFGWLYWTRI